MQIREREATNSATQPQAPVFVARGLTKVYGSGDSQVVALKDIDLDIRQGEFIVLLGPSGSANRPCSTSSEDWMLRHQARRPGEITN